MGRIDRLMRRGVVGVVAYPRTALAVVGVMLLLSIAAAVFRLEISADQNKLFDPRVPFFRDYLQFVENFPENEAVFVVVRPGEGVGEPAVGRWAGVSDAIAGRLRAETKFVRSVDARVHPEEIGSQGLLFDDPKLVRKSVEDVRRFLPLVKVFAERNDALTPVLGATPIERLMTTLRVGAVAGDDSAGPFVGELARSWVAAVEGDGALKSGAGLPDLASLDAADPSRLGYYYVGDRVDVGRNLLLVKVFPRTDYASLTAISEAVEGIEAAVRDAAGAFPEFRVGLTGRPALDAAEMRTTDRDTKRAEVVALTAVFIGLAVVLRSVWLALAGEIALGVGIGWTFGWATVAVGELNLLSLVFLLALIGIGMDYLVQILVRYRTEVVRRSGPRTTFVAVFRAVSAPINTACLGAAGAFLVSTLTDFKGAAELGIIAGGGLLLCLLSGYVVLPALLTLFPVKGAYVGSRAGVAGAQVAGAKVAGARVSGARLAVLPLIWAAVCLAGLPLATRVGFNPNLLELQAPQNESVQLVRHLQTWSAVVVSKDVEVLRRVRAALEESPLVGSTESVLGAYDNLAFLRGESGTLAKVRWDDAVGVEAGRLEDIAAGARALAGGTGGGGGARELLTFAGLLEEANGAEAERIAARLSAWQVGFAGQLRASLEVFSAPALDLDRVPRELRSHLVGLDGGLALYIYPKLDLWEQKNLDAFAADVEARVATVAGAPKPTGIAINLHHSTASIRDSFYRATAYALGLIVVLVFLDFRRVGLTLMAVSVLGFGLPMLAIAMGLLGADWNFANTFALPILIGAGHEYGVFLVHRYLDARRNPRRPWTSWDASDRALLLCAYVTCTSFGFFWLLATHRGLQSLGLVMAVGTASIYLSSVFVLRPLLQWLLLRERRRGGAI